LNSSSGSTEKKYKGVQGVSREKGEDGGSGCYNLVTPKTGDIMSVQQINPQQASDILDKDSDAVYIDVRTEPEFQNGHPAKGVNIPVVNPDQARGQMTPNPDFVRIVQARFPKEKKIIVGCQAGGRSQYAADLLTQAGFKDISNMQGGFGGAKDPMGRVIAQGWVQMNLPVETRVDETNSYAAMKKGL
jgi:rhodanese-related sulfurtransferase